MAIDKLHQVAITKPGPRLFEDDGITPKKDDDGNEMFGPQIVLKTLHLKNLTSGEAMDASDFAAALSPTGRPRWENSRRIFALCAIRKIVTGEGQNITSEEVLRPRDLDTVEKRRDAFTMDEIDVMAVSYFNWTNQVNEDDDPKKFAASDAVRYVAIAEQLGIPRAEALKMTLGQLGGWIYAARIARHILAGGEYDEETGAFTWSKTEKQEAEENAGIE